MKWVLDKYFFNYGLFNFFMCTGMKMSDPLEMNFQTVVSGHVGAGN